MMRSLVFVFLLWVGVVLAQLDEDVFEEVPSTHMPHLLSSPSLVEATIGETVTFPCDVDDLGEFVMLWKKGKNRILFAGDLRIVRDDRIRIDKTSLVISSVQPKDSGEYVCQISTISPLELSHSLDVLYPPSVKPHPKDGFITVKEGETITLTCHATGNPLPIVSWKHAGRHYDSNDGSNFLITNAQKSDSGEYECIADNKIGDPASAIITVEVVSAPKIFPEPRSGLLVVKEGEQISISCEAAGDPTPVITWKTPNGEKLHKVREENKIVISEADRSHSGSYECIANNSLGIFTSAVIKVQVLYAPEVQVPNTLIHAKEGANVTISCIVRGEPDPSVMWKKGDGQGIHASSHYHIKTSNHLHSLQIHHLQEEDFGVYECTASNSLSSSSQKIHIVGTPQIPIFTSKPHGSQGTKYTISWTVNSQTPVDEYSLMYRKKLDNGEWETKTIPAINEKEEELYTQMFQLDDLEPATSYEAVVTARNKFGWSEKSEPLVFTTGKKEKYAEITTNSSSSQVFSIMSMLPFAFIFYYRCLH